MLNVASSVVLSLFTALTAPEVESLFADGHQGYVSVAVSADQVMREEFVGPRLPKTDLQMAAECHARFAIQRLMTGRHGAAVRSITSAIELDPANWRYLMLRSIANRQVGNEVAAKDDAIAALSMSRGAWAITPAVFQTDDFRKISLETVQQVVSAVDRSVGDRETSLMSEARQQTKDASDAKGNLPEDLKT